MSSLINQSKARWKIRVGLAATTKSDPLMNAQVLLTFGAEVEDIASAAGAERNQTATTEASKARKVSKYEISEKVNKVIFSHVNVRWNILPEIRNAKMACLLCCHFYWQ